MATKTALEKATSVSARWQELDTVEFGGSAMGKWGEFTGLQAMCRELQGGHALEEGSTGDDRSCDHRDFPVRLVFLHR